MENIQDTKKRTFSNYLLLYVKGIAIGACDIVPGISGGTIAFISGIYEELINSLRLFVPKNFKLIFQGKIKTFWKAVNANFLLAVALGAGTSLITLVKYVLYMLDTYPVVSWSFLFGLVFISTISVLKKIRKTTVTVVICFVVGVLLAFLITSLSAAQTPNELWFIFISGAVAICAMILPGISGTFILLLMGKYQYMLTALNEFKVTVLAVFASGVIIGLLSFSHFLSWLLRKYHDVTVALLAGVMFGALNKVWPWKTQVDMLTNKEWAWSMEKFNDNSLSLLEKTYLPQTFEKITGNPAQIQWAIAAAALAVVFFLTIETIGKKMGQRH